MSLLPPTPAPPQVAGTLPQPGALASEHARYSIVELLAVALSFLAMGVALALLALRWLPR